MHTSHITRLMACVTLFAFTSTACGGCGEDDMPPDMAQPPSDQGVMPDASNKADIPDTPSDMGTVTPDASPDMPVDNPDTPVDTPDMIPPLTEGFGELGWMVARSQVGDRPMFAELYGEQGPVLFLLSAIHGNERIAISFGERVRTALLGGMAERLGVRIFFVQAGNPDGINAASRANSRGIDLNRNFPAENFDPNGAGGTMPLSESESIMLARVLDWTEPAAVISVHCCGALIDHDGPGEDLGFQMQQAAQQHADFAFERLGSRPGSMGSYVGLTLNTPIITVEMDRNSRVDAIDQFAAIEAATEAAALWVAGQNDLQIDVLERVDPLEVGNHYRQIQAGSSSSGLPLRLDTIGQVNDAPHNLVISGLNGSGRIGEHVAEHLRRQMLAEVNPATRRPLKLLTLANPESLQSQSTENLDGINILTDTLSDAPLSSEGQALRVLLEDPDLKTLYIVEDAAEDQHVVLGPDRMLLLRVMRNTTAGLRENQQVPSSYIALVDWLTSQGKNVVFLGARTDRYEDQHDSTADSPSIYWTLIEGTL